MLISMSCVSYHQRLCGCLWSVLAPEAKLMSMDSVAAKGHDVVVVLLGWKYIASVICAPAGGHDGVCDSCFHQRSYLCVWSVMLPVTMWMYVVSALTGGHVDVCGLCHHQRPCRFPWSVLLPEVMLVFLTCVAA